MTRDLSSMRNEYGGRPLTEDEVDTDPLIQFKKWFNEAIESEAPEPSAMILSTTGPDNTPSARVVLLKGVEQGGFIFYTNYGSRKSMELEVNNRASLLFFWPVIFRQVRIVGTVDRIPGEKSDAYFSSRPRDSQIGAWASAQSDVIESRNVLEQAFDDVRRRFGDGPIPRPETWGGYRLIPDLVEFWQGRPSRLHDRLEYRRVDGSWRLTRLSP